MFNLIISNLWGKGKGQQDHLQSTRKRMNMIIFRQRRRSWKFPLHCQLMSKPQVLLKHWKASAPKHQKLKYDCCYPTPTFATINHVPAHPHSLSLHRCSACLLDCFGKPLRYSSLRRQVFWKVYMMKALQDMEENSKWEDVTFLGVRRARAEDFRGNIARSAALLEEVDLFMIKFGHTHINNDDPNSAFRFLEHYIF